MVGNRDQLLHVKSLKLGAIDWPTNSETHASVRRLAACSRRTVRLIQRVGLLQNERFDSLIATSGMAANLGGGDISETNRRPCLN